MLIRKNDAGRSIVEMLGVLAIMGVITVMGISGYSQAVGKINRNTVVEDVTRIVQEVRGLYAGKSNGYDTVPNSSDDSDDDVLVKIGFRKKGDTHPFGGVYYVSQGSEGVGYKTSFVVNITGLEDTDCYYFANYGWQGAVLDDDGNPKSTCTDGKVTIEFN